MKTYGTFEVKMHKYIFRENVKENICGLMAKEISYFRQAPYEHYFVDYLIKR